MKRLNRLKRTMAICIVLFCLICNQIIIYGQANDIKTGTEGSEAFQLEGMPELTAQGAIVVDMSTGYTLYEKNIYTAYYPASITKIMTAILSIENLNLEDIVTFSHDAVYSIEPGSSAGYLREGEQITVEQCLYGLMLISGNDIANGLGEAVAGSMDAFALRMTQKAKELGCKQTNFTNAHGLHDENHYTCPYDMAVIAKYAYETHAFFRTLIAERRFVVEPTEMCDETRYWHNNNRLTEEGHQYYDEDCLGGKTGFTDEAGGTLVSFHEINGRTILIVLMKDTNSAGTFADTIAICDYITENTDEEYFAGLDEAYKSPMEQEQKEDESTSAVTDSDGTSVKQGETETSAAEVGGGTFPLPVAIILLLVVLFVLYYFYISVQRRKRRRRKKSESKIRKR